MSKFKNTEELEKAYQELEREFTKKSQKLALYDKINYVTLLNKEIDSLVDDYAKRKISNLEAKLAESEKQIKDAREAGNMAVDSWCKNRRKYEAQIAEMQNKSFILYSMLYETLEKQGCENVASQIDQMTGWTYDKEADWLKGNRNYDQLKQSQKQLAIGELRRIKEYILINDKYDEEVGCNIIETFDLLEDIRDRIEKLGGGENE